MERNTLSKAERMVSKKLTELLFSGQQSSSFAVYPLRAVWMTTPRAEGAEPVQILISVPKKRFHHAVDRNRVKRQVREAYRHHKHQLIAAVPADRQLSLAFVWLCDRHWSSDEVERRVVTLLRRITEKQ